MPVIVLVILAALQAVGAVALFVETQAAVGAGSVLVVGAVLTLAAAMLLSEQRAANDDERIWRGDRKTRRF